SARSAATGSASEAGRRSTWRARSTSDYPLPHHLRAARVEDVSALVTMLVGQTPWQELGYDAARCRGLIADRLEEIVVAADAEDRPAGFLRWRPDALLGQPYLHLLAVAPGRRRSGVGRALMVWLEEEVFLRRRLANLFLCVSAFNAPARAFYVALGYQ